MAGKKHFKCWLSTRSKRRC